MDTADKITARTSLSFGMGIFSVESSQNKKKADDCVIPPNVIAFLGPSLSPTSPGMNEKNPMQKQATLIVSS